MRWARRRILTATQTNARRARLRSDRGGGCRAAEVGSRTVFRYFASRDALLAAALEDWLHDYAARLPASPGPGQDPSAWLASLALQVQLLHVELGDFVWEISPVAVTSAQDNADLFNALAKVHAERERRSRCMARRFGGAGDPPDWVVDAFAVALSSYTTNRLLELGRTTTQIGEVMAATLEAVLTKALTDG